TSQNKHVLQGDQHQESHRVQRGQGDHGRVGKPERRARHHGGNPEFRGSLLLPLAHRSYPADPVAAAGAL
ncbi:MAG: hypothetical protein ACK55Z_03425, partial [bacterium]